MSDKDRSKNDDGNRGGGGGGGGGDDEDGEAEGRKISKGCSKRGKMVTLFRLRKGKRMMEERRKEEGVYVNSGCWWRRSKIPGCLSCLKEPGTLDSSERYLVLKEASRLYGASWFRDIGPELRPNDYKMKEEGGETFNGEKGAPKEREPSTLDDLAVAARGGMETLKPALQRVYMTRASAYRDALRSFIGGYEEGIQQVMETKEEGKFQQGEGTPKKPT